MGEISPPLKVSVVIQDLGEDEESVGIGAKQEDGEGEVFIRTFSSLHFYTHFSHKKALYGKSGTYAKQ